MTIQISILSKNKNILKYVEHFSEQLIEVCTIHTAVHIVWYAFLKLEEITPGYVILSSSGLSHFQEFNSFFGYSFFYDDD